MNLNNNSNVDTGTPIHGTMRASVIDRCGGGDVLRTAHIPIPVPGPGEVRVRIRAASINHVDLDIRSGLSRFPLAFPHVLGREAAGEVDLLGPDVAEYQPGDRVVVLPLQPCGRCSQCLAGADNLCPSARTPGINIPGGYAQWMVVQASGLLRLPDAVSYEAASATLVALGTAWRMLVTVGQVQPGETVLVNGAGGGLGSAAVQVASQLGAIVIATAGSTDKLALARSLGAGTVINYRTDNLVEAVRKATGGKGVDMAVEHVGGAVLQQTIACMAPRGRVVTAGAHAGEVVPIDIIPFFRSEIRLMGSKSQSRSDMLAALNLVAEGKLSPQIGKRLPLEAAAEGHRLLESREIIGKVVLFP